MWEEEQQHNTFKRTSLSFLSLVIGGGLFLLGAWILGPRSDSCQSCLLCGRNRQVSKWIGIATADCASENEVSRWADPLLGDTGHEHDWASISSSWHGWSGSGYACGGDTALLWLCRHREELGEALVR